MDAKKAAQRSYDLMAEIPRDESGNPLTLEGAVRSIILKSPGMAQYRDDALGIMYCLLGSGIGWRTGRLGDTSLNNYMNMPPQTGGQGCWTRKFGLDESLLQMTGASEDTHGALNELKQRFVREDEHRIEAIIQTIQQINQRCQQYRPGGASWYPISWFGCNLCVPSNAQEDFRDGAIETATLILNTQPTPGTQRWVVHQRTKQYAKEILEAMEAIHENTPKGHHETKVPQRTGVRPASVRSDT